MKIAQIQFTPWDKVYNFSPNDLDIKVGDYVVVETELGMEMGKVVSFKEVKKAEIEVSEDNSLEKNGENPNEVENKREIKPILRKALPTDLDKLPDYKEKRKALEACKDLVEKYELPMKLVDVHFSFDDSRITFAFISDGRVDFRELVKDLTRQFSRSIRLQQIGIRDEAKLMGDYGHCGKQLCCRTFLKDLASITSEMAEAQQCVHRGSDRISGVCGRLMCCLAYENEGYEEMGKKMPPLGAKVNVDGKRGIVVGHHILKQTVDVEFDDDEKNGNGKGKHKIIVEVDLNRNKK